MATTVNVHQAKTHLSKLLARVEAGEEIVIARNGKPVARLVAASTVAQPRVPGTARGEFELTEEFYAPLSDKELADWYGDEPEGKRRTG